ncbi:MAG: N-acetylglucosamine kinase [Alphaproteobacteria bacterium]|nr:N-acetylglucosamine kinase [Alphaproteobacteria bacterium]
MASNSLFLGVDGGGTRCRARLCDAAGRQLGQGESGPANIRFGVRDALASVLAATRQALEQAHLTAEDVPRITACLALAGATEPAERDAAQAQRHAFHSAIITSDAHAACVGAHSGLDGAVVIVGTGSIGWAVLRGRQYRIGGWGFELSDEGSGAWIGRELLRRTLLAHDGRTTWSALTRAIFGQFSTAQAIVQFATRATSRDYAALAPAVVEQAMRQDETALAIMRVAAAHIDAIATRLLALDVPRLSLTGGLAPHMLGFLSTTTRARLAAPQGDALDGALLLARATELATAA